MDETGANYTECINQKEKHQYSILTHIYMEFRQVVTITLYARPDSKRDTDVSNSPLDSVGEGDGGMIWENGIETCIISYKKRIPVQV